MDDRDLLDLTAHGLSLLRLNDEAWQAIEGSRRHGERFSLNFPHAVARRARADGLVLVWPPASAGLRLGVVRSIGGTSTLDSRIVFDLLSPLTTSEFPALVATVTASALRNGAQNLLVDPLPFRPVSERLGEALIRSIAEDAGNGPALSRLLTHLRRPRRIEDARALQRDALSTALKIFGGDLDPAALSLPGAETALGLVRLREDTVIEHDARWIPGWNLRKSDLTGRAVFERRDERLDVFTANRLPLEALFGVDLIYFNQRRRALIMVQYKMLEARERLRRRLSESGEADDKADGIDWTARLDDQFTDELQRMRHFDRDLAPEGEYRLNSSPFYLKFMKRHARANAPGLLVSLGHFDQLLGEGRLIGKRGGMRLDYASLDGHYLRGEPFVELVRSGYIGTRDATTDHLEVLVETALTGNRAVVAAFQHQTART